MRLQDAEWKDRAGPPKTVEPRETAQRGESGELIEESGISDDVTLISDDRSERRGFEAGVGMRR